MVLTTAAGARRSASAFDRFLEASNTADVQLQYYSEEDIDERGPRRRCGPTPTLNRPCPSTSPLAFAEGSEYDLGDLRRARTPPLFTEHRRAPAPRGDGGPIPSKPHEVLINRVHAAHPWTWRSATPSRSARSAPSSSSEDVFEAPAGPDDPARGRRDLGDARTTWPTRSSSALLRHAGLPREVLGRGGWLRSHDRDRHRPGPDPAPVVERVVSEFELEEVFVSQQTRTRPRRSKTAPGSSPSG